MRAKRIQLTLHSGTPYGVRSAQLSNWNGKIIFCPRSAVKQLRTIPEAEQPAVYLLLGEDEQIYVGETDALANRIGSQVNNKEFWNEFVALTSPNLAKTEVKYLEHLLANKLRDDGIADLQNNVIPKPPSIQQVSIDVLEDFVEIASDVLVSLGVDFIRPSQTVAREASKGIEVFCKGPCADAKALYSEDGVLVKEGSRARVEETNTIPGGISLRRKQMHDNGLFLLEGESYRLAKDTLFSSPSTAASIILARSANGRTEWSTKDGKTIKQIEEG